MYLKDGTRDHFMGFIEREYPARWSTRYERLYAGAYAPKDYRSTVQRLVDVLQERYGVAAENARRRGTIRSAEPEPAPDRSSWRRWRTCTCDRIHRSPMATSQRAYADGRRARSPVSTSTSPSTRRPSKCVPSVQRWLIGSLICSSMTRFRKRAPNARL